MVPSTRRRVVLGSLASVASLAGCLDTADGPTDETPDEAATADGRGTEPVQSHTDTPVAIEPTIDWEDTPEFRHWLTNEPQREGSNLRFDYLDTVAPMFISPAIGFINDFSGDVTGSLVHNSHEIHLGVFDREAVSDAAVSFTGEADGPAEGYEYEQTGSYEGYTLFTDGLAVGEDAVLWNHGGDDATAAIDTRTDPTARLESAEPLFTAVFDRLSDGIEVTGQYGPPAGGNVSADEIHLWGGTRQQLDSQEMTWVFATEEAEDVTDELVAELEQVADDPATTVDGQFVRIEGTISLG